MLTPVTTWFLEMPDPARLRPAPPPSPEPLLMRAVVPCPELSRFLYLTVGADWCWIDRLDWPREHWLHWVERVETWVAYVEGTPAGYFELEPTAPGVVNIALLGLLPWAMGRRLGGWLLTRAVERAWTIAGTRLVTVNTCSLDSPRALPNYQARGFRIVHIHTGGRHLPERRGSENG